jgi:hypothetical protein
VNRFASRLREARRLGGLRSLIVGSESVRLATVVRNRWDEFGARSILPDLLCAAGEQVPWVAQPTEHLLEEKRYCKTN